MDDLLERPYLIRKNGFWYRPNCSGYTDSVISAGRYSLEEAERYTHPNGKDGPRDGMDFVHEDKIVDPDWKAFAAQADRIEALQADVARLRDALTRLRDCDWVISLPDRMDAVRNIARQALKGSTDAE